MHNRKSTKIFFTNILGDCIDWDCPNLRVEKDKIKKVLSISLILCVKFLDSESETKKGKNKPD